MAAVPNEHARFDLTVTAIEVAADIELEFEYSTDLFREDNVERWMAGLRTLLEQAAARPRAPISELSLTDAAARGELLRVGRGPLVPLDRADRIDRAFAARAGLHPGNGRCRRRAADRLWRA